MTPPTPDQPTPPNSRERTIRVGALARVEGEGGLHVTLQGDAIADVRLEIYEPPRFFEAFLRGRAHEDVPDITARICGICPVAYQMSAVHALEAALGVAITPEIRELRRLLYCGEWIESHALHMHLLQAPDFFRRESGLDLARDFPDEVRRGLRLKKHGNELLETLGGRAIHPINVRVGGFHKLPRREELERLIPDFTWGLEAAQAAARWVAGFPFPDFTQAYEFVALSHDDEYAMNEGRVVSSAGLKIAVDQFESRFEERHVPHSTALHCRKLPEGTSYLVGPLARINLNRDRLAPRARALADEILPERPCLNPFRAIVARGIEVAHAYETALAIIQGYAPSATPAVRYDPRAGDGAAATEAPRGLLYHRYSLGDDGRVTLAKIVPPTSQNQARIEDDLRGWLARLLPQRVPGDEADAAAALECEQLVRTYDPCISCSTHFLKLTVERRP